MGKAKGKFFKYISIIGAIVLLAVVAFILISLKQSSSLDQQISEFEAKRKIPDSENAAVIYEKLFTDVNFTSVFQDYTFRQISGSIIYSKPWKTEDHPEEAEWIKSRQYIIDELLRLAAFEKCVFPLPKNMSESSLAMDRLRMFRLITQFLVYASNNDIAEGRLDDAFKKAQFMFIMAHHISQQPLFVNYLASIAIEAVSLSNFKQLILETEINADQLTTIEGLPVQVDDIWNEQFTTELLEYEILSSKQYKETRPLLERIKFWFTHRSDIERTMETIHKMYFRLLTERRANRILIALRRYKNQNGQWPKSLEQIKPIVDPNVLIDPHNNGSFIYNLTETGFTLYSRGPNNIDEGGNRTAPADDWMIWPVGR
jgi:hypothetical protein